MRRWLFLALTLSAAGCATVSATKPGAPANFVKRSGLAADVKNRWLTASIIDPKTVFSPEEPRVTWWAEFTELAFLTKQRFNVKWYSPDGNLFTETAGSNYDTNLKYATAVLPLRETAAAQRTGRWHVEIYWQGAQIDTQSFLLGSPQEIYQSAQIADARPDKISQQPDATSEKKHLADSGLAVEAKNYPIQGQNPVLTLPGERFHATDEKVTWWGLLPLWSLGRWDSAAARWYDPNDVLVMETLIETQPGEAPKFGSAALPMRGQPWADQSGRWRVEVVRRGEIIDSRSLELTIAPMAVTAQLPPMPAQIVFEPPVETDPPPTDASFVPNKRVALLVFPASSVSINSYDGERAGQEKWLEEPVPMYLEFPDDRLSAPERYGYSLVYSALAGKYQPSFGWAKDQHFDLFTPSLDEQDWAAWRQRFPNDISEPLSQGFKEILRNHGFHVADLTPYRHHLEGYSGSELIEQYARPYGAEALLLIGYIANSATYSSTVTYPYKNIRWGVGLNLTYQATLYDAGHRRSLFHFTEEVNPFPTGALLEMDRVTYLDKDGFPIAKDAGQSLDKGNPPPAVLEDEWIVERVVSKIRGKEYGQAEKVKIGGAFASAFPYAE